VKGLHLSRYLDTDGDGTGTKNATGNYSGAVEEFYITPAAGERFDIARLIVNIEDTGGGTVQEYGNIGTALSNGIEVYVENEHGTKMFDITDDVPILSNGDWARLCHDVVWLDKGSGNDHITARLSFNKFADEIHLEAGQKFIVTVNDDLTGLVAHYFKVQGWME